MIGIYLITNNANGKMYVGQSYNVNKRLYEHKRKLKENSHCNEHLQSAWNKYGEDAFSFEVLEECGKEHIDELERWYIKELQTQDRTKGYNSEGGGRTCQEVSAETRMKLSIVRKGKKHTEEAKRKMSASSMGQVAWNKGLRGVTHHTEETRRRISQTLKGREVSEYARQQISKARSKPIACIEFEEMGAIFPSITMASKRTGIDRKSINDMLIGKNKTAGGLHWRYLEKGEN